jgi:plasmid stabilization system protein ParE
VNLLYTRHAQTDIDVAMSWYENQRKGLGFEFLDSIEESVNRIIENPESYPLKHKRYHCALTRRFPFTLFYTIEKMRIVVHAVFDNRQDPDKKP